MRTGIVTAILAMSGVILAGCSDATSTTSTDAPALYINELMAQNDNTIADTDGSGGYPDWIEVYNAGTSSVDLGGMYLTDDLGQPTKWRIPDGVSIPAKGFLVFWADNDPEQGSLHTNFKLGTTGEALGLFKAVQNGYVAVDTVTFGPQTADVSYGRSPDGSNTWQTFSVPTPGRANM